MAKLQFSTTTLKTIKSPKVSDGFKLNLVDFLELGVCSTALAAGPQPDHLQNSDVVSSRTSRQSTDIPGGKSGSISADQDIAFIRPRPAHRTGVTNQDWSAQVLVFSAQSVELHPTSNTNDGIPNSFQNTTEDISVANAFVTN